MGDLTDFPLITILPYQDPDLVFSRFADDEFSLFLDSSTQPDKGFSFIAVKPFDYVICQNGKIETKAGCFQGNPWDILSQVYRDYHHDSTGLGFQGGLAGFLGYEMGSYLETLPQALKDEYDFPDCVLGLYDLVIVFDHAKQTMSLLSQGWPETDRSQRFALAKARLAW